jgi:hypothetical protein
VIITNKQKDKQIIIQIILLATSTSSTDYYQ